MMRVKGLTGPQADSVHRIRGLMAPQVAVGKAVARCSWLVARKNPTLDKNGLWLNLTAALSDKKSTSQSASLTAPLSGEPLRTAICGLRTAFIS